MPLDSLCSNVALPLTVAECLRIPHGFLNMNILKRSSAEFDSDDGEEEPIEVICKKAKDERSCSASSCSPDPMAACHEKAIQIDPECEQAIRNIISGLDTNKDSVVITSADNDHPIVYVTKEWQRMCGFSERAAVGSNPRLTQGPGTDRSTIVSVGKAISEKKACKFQLINYRGGVEGAAFWNVVNIMPVLLRDQVKFYVATLKDYSYHMTKLIKLPALQFCKDAKSYQRQLRLTSQYSHPSKPCLIHVDSDANSSNSCSNTASGGGSQAVMPIFVKRLGWSGIPLDPDYLHIRVQDAFAQLGITYKHETSDTEQGEVFNVLAETPTGVVCGVIVVCDGGSDKYRIDVTRLKGNTFEFHDAYRKLKEKIMDLVATASPEPAKGLASFRKKAPPLEFVGGHRKSFPVAPTSTPLGSSPPLELVGGQRKSFPVAPTSTSLGSSFGEMPPPYSSPNATGSCQPRAPPN